MASNREQRRVTIELPDEDPAKRQKLGSPSKRTTRGGVSPKNKATRDNQPPDDPMEEDDMDARKPPARKDPPRSPTKPTAITQASSGSAPEGNSPYSAKAARPPSRDALLQANLQRDRTVFFDFAFRVDNPAGDNKDLIAAGRKAAITALKLLASVNDTLVLRAYDQAKEADKSAKAILGKSGLGFLPKTQNKIGHYLDGFRVRGDAEYVMYTKVRLSLNGDDDEEENFILSARALLAEEKGALYRKTLQVAETSTIGFLLNSHQHMDVEGLQRYLAFQMDVLDKQYRSDQPPRQTPLMVGLNRRPIWDGIRKKDRPKGYKSTHAIHVEVMKGQEDTCRLLLKAVLMSAAFKRRFNLPLLFMKALGPADSRKEKMQHAIQNHRSALASMEHTHTVDFAVLDKKLGSLQFPAGEDAGKAVTMRRCLLAMQASDDSPLFLTVEKDRTGAGVWFTYAAKHQAEAAHRIATLPLYLLKTWDSPDTLKWFTPEAKDRMTEMDWDETTKRAITVEEKEMTEALQTYDSEEMGWIQFDLKVVLDEEAKRKEKLALLVRPDQSDQFDHASLATTGTNNTTGKAQQLLQAMMVNRQDSAQTTERASETPGPPGSPPPPGTSPEGGAG